MAPAVIMDLDLLDVVSGEGLDPVLLRHEADLRLLDQQQVAQVGLGIVNYHRINKPDRR